MQVPVKDDAYNLKRETILVTISATIEITYPGTGPRKLNSSARVLYAFTEYSQEGYIQLEGGGWLHGRKARLLFSSRALLYRVLPWSSNRT